MNYFDAVWLFYSRGRGGGGVLQKFCDRGVRAKP